MLAGTIGIWEVGILIKEILRSRDNKRVRCRHFFRETGDPERAVAVLTVALGLEVAVVQSES